MSIEGYYARTAIDLVSWVQRDPERAFEMGMKLIGMGVILAALAVMLSD